MTTTIELNRTDLTQYETEKLHLADRKVADHSLAVGAFMTRYGRPEVLQEAADLFLSLLDELVADTDIRTGALDYAMFMAECGMNDRHASQAYRLREEFQFDLYLAAISTREGNEARKVAKIVVPLSMTELKNLNPATGVEKWTQARVRRLIRFSGLGGYANFANDIGVVTRTVANWISYGPDHVAPSKLGIAALERKEKQMPLAYWQEEK